jgi:hypothetical protein
MRTESGGYGKAILTDTALPFRKVWLLERFYVLSLPSLGPLDDVKLHALALLQAPETTGLDCRKVHENIFARLPADESVPLGIVEPLNCSLFHVCIAFSSEFTLEGVGR